MSDYFFFIDDSGPKEWITPYNPNDVVTPPDIQDKQYWRNNYFVLAGIHIAKEHLGRINSRINELKNEYFGTHHVELKSDWFRNPHKSKKNYETPFNITKERLREFTDKIYEMFANNTDVIKIQAVVLDKRYYKHRAEHRRKPLVLTTTTLLDRLEFHDNSITIVFDQMEANIKSTKFDHGHILDIANHSVDVGQLMARYSHTEIRFEKSKNSNFLQLADLAAYNVYRQFLDSGNAWEVANPDLPTYEFFSKIENNFHCGPDSRINGYGIIKLPDPTKVGWCR